MSHLGKSFFDKGSVSISLESKYMYLVLLQLRNEEK
jgi:hypothetical protein